MRVGAAVDGLEQGYSPSRPAGDPAPSRPRTELRRVTVCEHDERLQVKSVRGVGFTWRCTCGEHGRRWGSRADALAAKREHEDGHR